MDQSARSYLADLDRDGDLIDVPGRVDLEYELAAVLALWDDGPAIRMQVDHSEFPVIGNVLNSRARVARAIGCGVSGLSTRISQVVSHGIAPEVVVAAPCQQRVITAQDDSDLLGLLPIPTFFSKDSGPYVTAGLIVAHEPDSGVRNASYARLKPIGPNSALIGIAPNHHLAALSRQAREQGRPLDIAIALGAHPAIQLAACLYLGLGEDELRNAGALLGEPVRVVQAQTVDVLVPAEAEIVIEGRIHSDRLIEEGWVNEYHGMYEDYGNGFEVEITAITHRANGFYQVILPGLSSEHALLGGLSIGAGLMAALRSARIDVVDIAVKRAGGGRVDVVAAVRDLRPGAARRAFFACWAAVSMIKRVTLVDPDVDVWDYEHVEWARISRMRCDEDVLVVPDVITDRNEPMQAGGVVTKIGMDATMKPGRRRTGWDRALPPTGVLQAAARRCAPLAQRFPFMPAIGVGPIIEGQS